MFWRKRGKSQSPPGITDLRLVRLYFRDNIGKANEYLVSTQEIELLLAASLEIHRPGGRGKGVGAITVSKLMPEGPYWWTTPGLGNDYTKGATLYHFPEEIVIYREDDFDAPLAMKVRAYLQLWPNNEDRLALVDRLKQQT